MALKSNLAKKVLIVGGALAAVQLIAMFAMSKNDQDATDTRHSIEAAVNRIPNISPDRREMMKVQVALADYMSKHGGVPPKTLNELVGPYFENLPLDPATSKPYKYTVEGNRYTLGEKVVTAPSQPAAGAIVPVASPQKTMSPKELDAARDQLLSVLTQDDSQKNAPYDPTGKRDPFKPFEIAPKDTNGNPQSPLETLAIDKLSYSAYVESDAAPKAIIETPEGRGYTVSKGTKIGLNGGQVTDILPNKIIIVETQTDFTGQQQSRTVEIPIGVRRGVPERRK